MKHLLLAPLLLTLLVASCSNNKKYNSYREAVNACNEWVKKGGTYKLKNPEFIEWSTRPDFTAYKEEIYNIPLRWCSEEKETKQILGLRIPKRKKDSEWSYKKRCFYNCDELKVWEKNDSKVESNFYY